MLDLKEIYNDKHKALTGFENKNILQMARYISDKNIPMWIRHVLVPGITDDESSLKKTAEFIDELKSVERVEILPYHTLGLFKWDKLGIKYPLKDVRTPSDEEIKKAELILRTNSYKQ
jgi:pyruvate formate lyase activating enzyme